MVEKLGVQRLQKLGWLFPVLLIAIISTVFEPSWMTNDDAAMSMVAHGYGAIAEASPKLIFTNIYWGKVIQSLPTIGGVYGYSLATYLVLAVSSILCFLFLQRRGLLFWECSAILLTAIVVAVLFPQFTITAGMASVAAVLCLIEYSKTKQIQWLLLSIATGFIGFLIRKYEFALVVGVGLPFLPWAVLYRDLRFIVGAVLFGIIVAFAFFSDKSFYESDDWSEYKTTVPTATEFVAYSIGPQLLERSEL
ncbi:MAG: hypothetical protein AAF357_01565, partial [Verrucomicrobiota bacterium]